MKGSVRSVGPAPALAVVASLAGGRARADSIPWSYTLDVLPQTNVFPGTSGVGQVTFALAGNGDASKGNTGPVGALSAVLGGASSDTYNNVPYALVLDLKDTASQADKKFTFHGALNGTLTQGGTDLQATFSDPSQMKQVGNNDYTIPLIPTSTAVTTGVSAAGGSVTPAAQGPTITNARITHAPPQSGNNGGGNNGGGNNGGGGIHPAQVPEPSSLVLAGL